MITLLVAAAAMASGASCQGADPAIVSVVSAKSMAATDVNRFTLTVTVANLGSQNQAQNVLQSVTIVLDGSTNGEKGIPPLRVGQRYSFPYDVIRAEGTEPGSTTVRLHLVQHSGSGVVQGCDPPNDRYRIKV